ncbi:type IV secretory system conjugative DNA transfer family protein, partial [Candidatus Micrarchaeota archaeon]|nr:type IV secretory system conjugative DNA transfer family protein [Candidatus Micrarchaeota archaeon]
TSIDELTLENLNLLLTDSTKRSEFASMCENAEVKRFFDEEFSDIYMQHFNDAILPIINFIGEYLLYLGGEKKLENLEELLQKNRLNIISFNPHFFGRKIVKFFAGSVINQMYTLAINNKLKKPTILIVDEFPVVQTNVVRNILAEARKFNLYIYTSVQYMGQLDDEVLDSVMGNVRNVIAFKVTREDAKLLSSMMEIKVEEYFKKKMTPSELEEAKHEMFINLHPRQCVVRLFEGKRYLLTMKVQTVDIKRWVNE